MISLFMIKFLPKEVVNLTLFLVKLTKILYEDFATKILYDFADEV